MIDQFIIIYMKNLNQEKNIHMNNLNKKIQFI